MPLHDVSSKAAGAGLFSAYAYLREEQTSGTNGGGASSGSWFTRALNTETDPGGIVTLSSNQFTLQAGTYWISARAPGFFVNQHKVKIRNITDSSDALIGSSEYSGNNIQSHSYVAGRFTIAGAKTFELQQQVAANKATDGQGVASSFSVVEVYGEVEIWKEA